VAGIGPIGRIAPSPGPGPGRIVGLRSALNLAADVGSAVSEAWPYLRGSNDAPEGRILGNADGRLVVQGVPGVSGPPDSGPPGGFSGAVEDLGDVAV
jgi:hypothetical protein